MTLLPCCTICDALLKGYGNNTRCERCAKPCPVCGGNRAQCHHPLEDVPEDRWTVTRGDPLRRGGASVHFSSATDLWATPQATFDELNAEFGFETDVCAIAENAKCVRFFSPEQDGLSQDWRGTCWMNPPYGRQIGRWMRKAYESSLSGTTVVCLVPARTDTAWWHDYAAKGEVRFLRGRLKFGGAVNSAPFPSAIVVFRPTQVRSVPFPPPIEEAA